MAEEVELDDLVERPREQHEETVPAQHGSPSDEQNDGIPEDELPIKSSSQSQPQSAQKLPKKLTSATLDPIPENPTEPPEQPKLLFWTVRIEEAAIRDHAALERTFLSYLRTSTAFAHFGVAIAQLFRLNTDSRLPLSAAQLRAGKALGALAEGVAIVVLLAGLIGFGRMQAGLVRGVAIAREEGIWIVGLLGLGLLAGLCGLVGWLKVPE